MENKTNFHKIFKLNYLHEKIISKSFDNNDFIEIVRILDFKNKWTLLHQILILSIRNMRHIIVEYILENTHIFIKITKSSNKEN
jgi:hypothetical protein